MESIWIKTSSQPDCGTLHGDYSTEAAVIGGGLAGILTGYFLQQNNVKTIIIEADEIGHGQTKNTTAKITSQHNLIYNKLLENFGKKKAEQYAMANQQAIDQYRYIVSKEAGDCFFEELPAYLYSTNRQDIPVLEKEVRAAERLGILSMFTENTTLPFEVAGAVKFSNQAQFHPLRFLEAISKNLTVFEHTMAEKVEGNRILTDKGIITAKHIIFATHFPFINAPGYYFARMHQGRSYVLAVEGVPKIDGMYLGVEDTGLSFRSFNNVLLLGGGSHRTGENSAGGKYKTLREKASEFYPKGIEIGHWSAQDCMTLDGIPYIGQFSHSTPNWYVATGFGKWGMTGSMVSAMIISDLIKGRENSYSELFSPLRFTPSSSVKNLTSNLGQAVKGISRQALFISATDLDDLPVGHGGIIKKEGENIGVYKDENGRIYAVSTRCPHLGCQLEWNPDEKSWDCPCHGSRFDYKGNILDNPAQINLETSKYE
ncbi:MULTISPECIES: FAD-dependent oxidoreductase [unclassified Sedimentibacter]|uniref:FAD-dependent oxidoreductase n=1 Tax=unclassified Sedimentibacter TaxID=2649220 RepID=UPI0027DFAE3E|nr:FAD-dependent oxidoreductase [Sedimentibacter sp. MB35-C1]WMJ76345.1 FAD-dependent oxidoreductase [Sedimentibacter sp. MB35-C1]